MVCVAANVVSRKCYWGISETLPQMVMRYGSLPPVVIGFSFVVTQANLVAREMLLVSSNTVEEDNPLSKGLCRCCCSVDNGSDNGMQM
jgi:ABC-type Fe3+ transport system permease subunit